LAGRVSTADLSGDLVDRDAGRLRGAEEAVVVLDHLRRRLEGCGDRGQEHGGDRERDHDFDQAQTAARTIVHGSTGNHCASW
jgi:hypothetical protein